MPTLEQVLADTMLHTAARGIKLPLERRVPTSAVPRPTPAPAPSTDADVIQTNPIWSWSHDPANPRALRDITIRSRGMGMNYDMAATVARSIEFGDVKFTFPGRQDAVVLPLVSAFHCATYALPSGRIADDASYLWRLPSEVDASIMHVFAYQLLGDAVAPLALDQIDALGVNFMPSPLADALHRVYCVLAGESAAVATLAPPRVLVCVSLTCCKELNDAAPGEVVGAARLYPHVMVMSNVTGERIEATIEIQRPMTAMSHGDPEMSPRLAPLFVTDRNEPSIIPQVRWDNIFDYYTTQPHVDFADRPGGQHGPERREVGEVCFADPSARERTIAGAVAVLNSVFTPVHEPRSINKQARQGEFDNIHLAPRMRLEVRPTYGSEPPDVLEDIAMAPFCVHDCLHMHLRWGTAGSPKKPLLGFSDNGAPHAKDGAPHVPPDQFVFIRLTSAQGFRYRAVATGPIVAGAWTCFMHHGLFYAIDVWPGPASEAKIIAARMTVQDGAKQRMEPYMRGGTNFPSTRVSWAAFYWRLRWGGRGETRTDQSILERLKVLNLERCMR